MANFTPQKIDLSLIHGGQRYENGKTLDASAINAALEGVAYAQANAKGAVLVKLYQISSNISYKQEMDRYYIPNSNLPEYVKECLDRSPKALFWYYYNAGVPRSYGQDIGTVNYPSYYPTENDVFFWNGDLYIPKVSSQSALAQIQIHLLFIL